MAFNGIMASKVLLVACLYASDAFSFMECNQLLIARALLLPAPIMWISLTLHGGGRIQ
jgi:hypothetical protein